MKIASYTILFILMMMFQNSSYAGPDLKVVAAVLDAFNQISSAHSDIKKTKDAIIAVQSGDNSAVGGTFKLEQLESIFKKAEQTLKSTDIIPNLNLSPYSISMEEITNCYIRARTESKFAGFIKEYERAIEEGNQSRIKLMEFSSSLKNVTTEINELKILFQELSGIPIYQSYFIFDWFVLQTRVGPSLGSLKREVKRQLTKLDKNISDLSTGLSNFKSNIELIRSTCKISGTYSGTCRDPSDGETSEVKLAIAISGNKYRIDFYMDGEFEETFYTSINNNGKFRFIDEYPNAYPDVYSGQLNKSFSSIENFKSYDVEEVFMTCNSLRKN